MRNTNGIFQFAIAAMIAGVGVLFASAVSADVACNRYGDCWHVGERYTTYPTDLGVTFYSDDWRGQHMHDSHYHWYDRDDDHGYYLRGEWHPFERGNDHDHD